MFVGVGGTSRHHESTCHTRIKWGGEESCYDRGVRNGLLLYFTAYGKGNQIGRDNIINASTFPEIPVLNHFRPLESANQTDTWAPQN